MAITKSSVLSPPVCLTCILGFGLQAISHIASGEYNNSPSLCSIKINHMSRLNMHAYFGSAVHLAVHNYYECIAMLSGFQFALVLLQYFALKHELCKLWARCWTACLVSWTRCPQAALGIDLRPHGLFHNKGTVRVGLDLLIWLETLQMCRKHLSLFNGALKETQYQDWNVCQLCSNALSKQYQRRCSWRRFRPLQFVDIALCYISKVAAGSITAEFSSSPSSSSACCGVLHVLLTRLGWWHAAVWSCSITN